MPATQAVLDVIFPTYSPLLLSLGIRDRQTLGSIQAKAPIFLALALEPLRAAKAETLADQAQRISRMGRDNLGIVNGQNFGHSVRQTAIYSHNGELLRAADVEIVDAGDVRNPNSILRRARRTDPLETLMRVGTINGRDYEAGEILRQDLERQGAKLPAGTMPARPSPPWNRVGVNDAQREAMFAVREALDAVAAADRMALLWLLAGGSLKGFAMLSHTNHQHVARAIQRALCALVDFYGLGDPP